MVLSGARSEAFPAYKLGALAIALMAPFPVWVGFLLIGFSGIAPVVQYFLSPLAVQQAYALQEPWYTMLYAVIAGVVLHHRLKSLALERKITRVDAEKRALDDMAGIFLALRDLTNTPLQSIELVNVLLETGNIERAEAAQYLQRAVVRLRLLSDVLASYRKDVDWDRAHASFDAVAVLERKFLELGLVNNKGGGSGGP